MRVTTKEHILRTGHITCEVQMTIISMRLPKLPRILYILDQTTHFHEKTESNTTMKSSQNKKKNVNFKSNKQRLSLSNETGSK